MTAIPQVVEAEVQRSDTPSAVANYFISKAMQEDLPITQMKLMKLVYIGYGWVLALLDRRLFDEEIQAWKHGPVIPSLYHTLKHFGNGPITSMATEFDLDDLEFTVHHIEDEDTKLILDKVWSVYKPLAAMALRHKTHEDGSPWKSVYKARVHNIVIPDETIKAHFIRKINEYVNAG